ncbi:uncharacterized protein phf11 isoform X3 [Girardinichthys multiradiatus]|uniref:uncharacterized protein phf11 isoform X3 n=1 Tax=Girardinichthys multiradiatus TaxID=208333 RepID=UPI001FADE00C|nr:uncharacterized protein phf11 isoform X3 [Girardinichthys multiradiatus]
MNSRTACCVLCRRSEETEITGNLSTKDQVTAHQNCLGDRSYSTRHITEQSRDQNPMRQRLAPPLGRVELYSSGIFCTNTPQFDDLFGFSVEDVLKEVKRGGKLFCGRCRRKGATAGCEVKRCKKTFHYPCAVEEGAKTFEDDDNETYGLYCLNHSRQVNSSSVNEPKTPPSSRNPSGTGSSGEIYCRVCEKKEENISLDRLSSSNAMLYCDKHVPSSRKRKSDPLAARLSSSSSSDSSTASLKSIERKQNFNEPEGESGASKRKSVKRNRILSDEHSNTDVEGLMAPLESDLEESVQEHESAVPLLISKHSKNPSGSSPGIQVENVRADVNTNEDETVIHSDAESESLLSPVPNCAELHSNPPPQTVPDECPQVQSVEKEVQTIKREFEESSYEQCLVQGPEEHVDRPCVPQQSPAAADPSPEHSKPSGHAPCFSFDNALHKPIHMTVLSSPSPSPPSTPIPELSFCQRPSPAEVSPTQTPPSGPKPDIDSATFWRNCNMAGCTQAIFTEFITEINNISCRIQCDQASQEDYDRALAVMRASGRLADFVTKQDEELDRRRMELQRASAALKDMASVLRR